MKAKLLKLLRSQITVHYYPSTKQYIVSGFEHDKFYDRKESAMAQRDCDIINKARKDYRNYAKRIRL